MSVPTQIPALPQLATLLRNPPSMALALRPGQVLDAKVVGPGAGGTVRIDVQGQSLNLLLPQPAAPGTILKLTVEAVTPQVRLSVQVPSVPAAPQAPVAGVGNGAPPAAAQQVLTQMVQAAVPLQGAATGLTAVLATLVGATGLPEPVLRAAQQVLAGRLDLSAGTLSGGTLKQAVATSGIFSEARLGSPATAGVGDAKSVLLALRSSLVAWLGSGQHPIAAPATVPPPLRGMTPRARVPDVQPVLPLEGGEPVDELGRRALDHAGASIARLRLHQHASLPDAEGRPAPALSLDVPVMVGGYQALLHLQIRQDGEGREEAGSADRGWQMRFAINLPALGEVGAQVSLRAGTAGVMLWATEEATAVALEQDIELLRAGLVAAGLQPGSLLVRHGEPAAGPQLQPGSHLLDERR